MLKNFLIIKITYNLATIYIKTTTFESVKILKTIWNICDCCLAKLFFKRVWLAVFVNKDYVIRWIVKIYVKRSDAALSIRKIYSNNCLMSEYEGVLLLIILTLAALVSLTFYLIKSKINA